MIKDLTDFPGTRGIRCLVAWSCNATTGGFGYLEIGLGWHTDFPLGSELVLAPSSCRMWSSESLVTIFGGEKYSNSLSSGEAPDSGSGMEKSRSGIRDGKIRDPG